MLASLCGLLAGYLYRTDDLFLLPSLSRRRIFRPLKSYRIPLSLHLLVARIFQPLVSNSTPPRRVNRVLPGQISDSSARGTAIAGPPPPSLRSLLAGRMGQGAARRSAGTEAARPVQPGGARAAMGEWVSEMAGRGEAGTRAPSEEEIATSVMIGLVSTRAD